MKTLKLFSSRARHRFLLLMLLTIFTCGNVWGADTELTFSLTSNPGGWPTTNSTTLTNYTYTLSGTNYTFALKNVKQNSGYLMLTSTAVLGLPAISGMTLTKVVVSNSNTCSTSTRVGISSSSSSASYISGGAYQTYSTTSSTYTYNLTGTSANTMYYLYVTNKNCQITQLKLTYSGGSTPSLTASPTSLDWGSVAKGTSLSTKTFSISGSNLTSGSLSITASSGWSVSPTSKSVSGTLDPTTITVTPPSTSTAGTKNGTITISGGGLASSVVVNLSLTVNEVDNFIDVVQSTSGYTEGSPHQETGSYSTPTLTDKSVATSGTCEEQHWHFMGWITKTKYDAGTSIAVGDLQTPTSATGTTYYAVWAKGSSSGGSDYELVTSSSTALADGDDIIIATSGSAGSAYAMGYNRGNNRAIVSVTIASGPKISSPTLATLNTDQTHIYPLQLEADGDYFRIIDKVNNDYLAALGGTSNNYLKLYGSSSTTGARQFTISVNASGVATIKANITGTNKRDWMRYNSGSPSVFACYNSGQNDIYIYRKPSVTYTDYLAKCCDNVVAAPTVSATDIHAHQFTLTWTNVTGADGYTVTCAGGTVGAVQSSSTTRTCTITGLASANTSYSWSVVATYSGLYCGATPANGSTTTAQVYAVTYNANGGTVSPLPSTVSYEAGVTVTVAAEPGSTSKSGCTFTGWNTQADGQGTHYAASGSATFTMPSSTVTLYAEWTKKKNYYVDRMHGTNDGHTVTIDDVVYNCYLREGAGYTVPTISDNTSGATTCHNEHDHLLFWVVSTSVNDDGTLKGSYTEVTPGSSKTATTDGTIYYAIWGKLAD